MPTNKQLIEKDARYIAKAMKVRYNPMVVDRAEGARLVDADGRRYLDFSSYWSIGHLGFDNQAVRRAVRDQMARTTFAGLVSNVHQPGVDLAEKLVELAGGRKDMRVWYGLSGSDACEAANRIIVAATGKRRIVTFVGSWHGTSDGSMAISASPAFNRYMLASNATKAPYPNAYRPPFGGSGRNVTVQCLDYLENYIFETISPPSETAAVFVETIQADSGEVLPPPDFMPKLRALCDRHNLLLVVDDIKVGLGRTGKMFSYQHYGIEPDMLILGKSLGGGLPLSAIVGRADILDAPGGFHGFTNSGNAACCAAGLATVTEIERQRLPERAGRNGRYLQRRLKEALGGFDIVGDVRGIGMIQGVELVQDRKTKKPNREAAAKIVFRAWELGLVCYYAGMWGSVIELTPPLILTRAEIDEGVDILARATRDYLEGDIPDKAIAPYAGW